MSLCCISTIFLRFWDEIWYTEALPRRLSLRTAKNGEPIAMQQLLLSQQSHLTLPDFDLGQTLCCGQAFRWRQQEDGTFCGVAGRHRALIRQEGSRLLIESDAPVSFWENYFDCATDYGTIRREIASIPVLAPVCEFAGGIRVLRQDGWEALASFILSQNNNIKRISGIIERLCAQFGDPIGEGFFSFPEPQRLAGLSCEDLAGLRCGFRARYLLDAAQKVVSGEVDLEMLPHLDTDQARAELMQIVGVGKKVADCALLFGFGHRECFPVDVWIGRALQELIPQGLPASLSGCAGIAQQMIFHYMRACPRAGGEGENPCGNCSSTAAAESAAI